MLVFGIKNKGQIEVKLYIFVNVTIIRTSAFRFYKFEKGLDAGPYTLVSPLGS